MWALIASLSMPLYCLKRAQRLGLCQLWSTGDFHFAPEGSNHTFWVRRKSYGQRSILLRLFDRLIHFPLIGMNELSFIIVMSLQGCRQLFGWAFEEGNVANSFMLLEPHDTRGTLMRLTLIWRRKETSSDVVSFFVVHLDYDWVVWADNVATANADKSHSQLNVYWLISFEPNRFKAL